jgi:hypothetical protein
VNASTFDGVDVIEYLSDNDDSIEQDDDTKRELDRIALQELDQLLATPAM